MKSFIYFIMCLMLCFTLYNCYTKEPITITQTEIETIQVTNYVDKITYVTNTIAITNDIIKYVYITNNIPIYITNTVYKTIQQIQPKADYPASKFQDNSRLKNAGEMRNDKRWGRSSR